MNQHCTLPPLLRVQAGMSQYPETVRTLETSLFKGQVPLQCRSLVFTYTTACNSQPIFCISKSLGISCIESTSSSQSNFYSENSRLSENSKVDYVSQWTLVGFPQPWCNEIKSISEVLLSLEQNLWSMLHSGKPGMTWGGHSYPWVVMQLGCGCNYSLSLPTLCR